MEGTRTSREVRERIAHYRCLQRMTADKRTLDALAHLIAEAEEQLRQLGPDQPLSDRPSGDQAPARAH